MEGLVKFVNQHERIFRLLFTSGLALIVAGGSYLQLPLKLFLGWLPLLGRIDHFIARCLVSVGIGSVALALVFEKYDTRK